MKKRSETLGLILLLLLSVLISFGYSVSADYTLDDSSVFQIDNVNYTFPAAGITFNSYGYNETMIYFENTYFNVSSTNNLDIELSYLNDNIAGASVGDTVLSFNASSSVGLVYFNLSGFDANQSYEVYRDNSKIQGLTSDADGVIRWTNTVWSEHDFDIKEGGNYVQVTYGRSALAEITPMGYDVLGMVGLIGIVLVGAAIILYVTRMGSDF